MTNRGASTASWIELLDERLQPRRRRPRAQASDGDRLVALGQVHDHRRDAGDVDLVRVHDAEGDARRDRCVDRVAARLEHRVPGLGGEIVAGDDHVARAGDLGLEWHRGRLRGGELMAWAPSVPQNRRCRGTRSGACGAARGPRQPAAPSRGT